MKLSTTLLAGVLAQDAQAGPHIDCAPEGSLDKLGLTAADHEKLCTDRKCEWNAKPAEEKFPKCTFQADHKHYTTGKAISTNDPNDKSERYSLSLHADAIKNRFEGKDFAEPAIEKLQEKFLIIEKYETYIRIRITDENDTRFEPPAVLDSPEAMVTDSENYKVTVSAENEPFSISVTRPDGAELFNTADGPLVYYDQFLQLTTRRAPSIYGFGETMHHQIQNDIDYVTQGVWARDESVAFDKNLYGHQPYSLALENDGRASGLLFFNAHPMDVVKTPEATLTFRAIGGQLDFFVFAGPSPEDVTRQYTSVIGRSYLFPYWSLGFQLCRWGYQNTTEVRDLIERNQQLGIPQDIQYVDIDYMDRQLDFTLDMDNYPDLPEFMVDTQKNSNMRWILIIDPAISADEHGDKAWQDEGKDYPTYTRGVDQNAYIKYGKDDGHNEEILLGKVWPFLPGQYPDRSNVVEGDDWIFELQWNHSSTAFPDFFRPSAQQWWSDEIVRFRTGFEGAPNGLTFDGIWIDMNEPTNFDAGEPGEDGSNQWEDGCAKNKWNFPPYIPVSIEEARNDKEANILFQKTICMDGLQTNPKTGSDNELHFNLHSLYGHGYSEGQPTLDACELATGERCMVVSRSTFPGAQRTVGHWLGDNKSQWDHIKGQMIGSMDFSLYGFSYTGPDICGFFDDSEEQLCARWTQLGAFFPYSRNHNGNYNIQQDPAVWGEEFAAMTRNILQHRYRLLPYLYTLMYRASVFGDTVIRPLFANWPEDKTTHTIDEQMMWADGMLVSPVLTQDTTEVNAYFPEDRWFDYYTGDEISSGAQKLDAPLDFIPLHLRGGKILPVQHPLEALTTMDSRMNPLGLVVSLDKDFAASGELYWDTGVNIDPIGTEKYSLINFSFADNTLTSTVSKSAIKEETHKNSGETVTLRFESIEINGLQSDISEISVESNGASAALSSDSWVQEANGRLIISAGIELPMTEEFKIVLTPGEGSSAAAISASVFTMLLAYVNL